jgi:UDPglucose--hexose-1-phosphate uridylyltransferase
MSEIRFNPVTRDWVIIAPERSRRPQEFISRRERHVVPSRVPTCPFCPGNESLTPGETSRRDADGRWIVRAVPNKFSALSSIGDVLKQRTTMFRQSVSGVGRHEVIIETPDHNGILPLLPLFHIENLLHMYRERLVEFYHDPRVQHVVVFKNHGQSAGTSLEHPHSQIVGTPVFPGQVMERIDLARQNYYYFDYGDCLYCSIIQDEMDEGTRMVAENESFVAFVPFAALSPFHLWVFPKMHRSCFSQITDSELTELAQIMRDVLLRLYVGLGDPDYNYVIRCVSESTGIECFHWYLAVIPRVSQSAGFEMGSGMFINSALPEDCAGFLRDVCMPNN